GADYLAAIHEDCILTGLLSRGEDQKMIADGVKGIAVAAGEADFGGCGQAPLLVENAVAQGLGGRELLLALAQADDQLALAAEEVAGRQDVITPGGKRGLPIEAVSRHGQRAPCSVSRRPAA